MGRGSESELEEIMILTPAFSVERVTRASAMSGDALVLAFTWAKTYRTAREAMRLNVKVKLTTLLLRDGAILPCCYFCILLSG